MKIAIIGYSGSGKSTLAQILGAHYSIPVLHLDTVHFLPNWQERKREEEISIVTEFLEKNESWAIDGSYSKVVYERRMEEADKIVFLRFNRFVCLYRALKRYKTYKGKSRASMTEGCDERMTWTFAWWVFWKGRERKRRVKFERILRKYPEKSVVCKNQRQLDKLLFSWGIDRKKPSESL